MAYLDEVEQVRRRLRHEQRQELEIAQDRPRTIDLVGTGVTNASTGFADPSAVQRWDELADRGLAAFLSGVGARDDLTVSQKVGLVVEFVSGAAGYRQPEVSGLDDGNLRIYVSNSGELAIQAAALTLDPDTTLEIVLQPAEYFRICRTEAAEALVHRQRATIDAAFPSRRTRSCG